MDTSGLLKLVCFVCLFEVSLCDDTANNQTEAPSQPSTTTTESAAERCHAIRLAEADEKIVYFQVSAVFVGRDFNPMLLNMGSTPYFAYSNTIRNEVVRKMCETYGVHFNKIGVIKFSEGSVIASFSINFVYGKTDDTPSADDIEDTLDTSAFFSDIKVQEVNPNAKSLSPVIIAAICISVGILLVAAILVFCAWRMHKRGLLRGSPQKRSTNRRRGRSRNHWTNVNSNQQMGPRMFGSENRSFGDESDIYSTAPPGYSASQPQDTEAEDRF